MRAKLYFAISQACQPDKEKKRRGPNAPSMAHWVLPLVDCCVGSCVPFWSKPPSNGETFCLRRKQQKNLRAKILEMSI